MTSTSFAIFLLITLSAASGDQIAGGIKEVDPARVPEITELLRNNLHKLEGETLNTLVEVTTITEQVVSGMLYTITGIFEDKDKEQFTCEITIWERAWLDEPDKLTFKVKSKTALTTAAWSSGSGSSTGTAAKEF